MTLPLEGIRILDSAHQYPGPYCSMLLADMGAEVLKVERPGVGDPARQVPDFFRTINRNKRSLTLDMKAPAGGEIPQGSGRRLPDRLRASMHPRVRDLNELNAARERYPSAFTPLKIRQVEIPNRIVFPPFAAKFAHEDGSVSDKLLAFYTAIAKGGAGMVITGSAGVSTDYGVVPGFEGVLTVASDDSIAGPRKVFEFVREHGSVAAIQICHPGRGVLGTGPGCGPAIGPSAVPNPVITVGSIRSLETAESVIASGKADLAAMGRAQVADHDIVRKSAEGRDEEIRRCVGCGTCLYWLKGDPEIYCSVNPAYKKKRTRAEGKVDTMPRDGIRKTSIDRLEQDVEELLALIGYRPTRDRILLKPNIVAAAPPENGDDTHPKVTEALIHYFRKRDREVVVAEGSGIFDTGRAFERLLEAAGYLDIRDRLKVPIINLEQVEREDVPWRYSSISLPKMLGEYEYINVPTMKTHLQTLVTLGVKNQKGLLQVKTKKLFHKKDLHACIHALSEVVKPSLTLVDGLYCVEGTGPTGPPVGEMKRMDLLVAGKGMMAVDNVCTEIMGFDVGEVKHLRPVKDIEVIGENVENVKSPFKGPMRIIRADPFVVHSDDRTCSMCSIPFYRALTKIFNTPDLCDQFTKRTDRRKVSIVMGPSDPQVATESCRVCLGDCSAGTARRKGIPHIQGCHPDYRDIVNFFCPGAYPERHDPPA